MKRVQEGILRRGPTNREQLPSARLHAKSNDRGDSVYIFGLSICVRLDKDTDIVLAYFIFERNNIHLSVPWSGVRYACWMSFKVALRTTETAVGQLVCSDSYRCLVTACSAV